MQCYQKKDIYIQYSSVIFLTKMYLIPDSFTALVAFCSSLGQWGWVKDSPAQGYVTLPQQVEDPGAVVQYPAFTYVALSQ